MRFLIITHTPHKIKNNSLFAYEPYMREMNLWAKNVNELVIIAPKRIGELRSIDAKYNHESIKWITIPSFNILNLASLFLSIIKIPYILFIMVKEMFKSDHIHLRCPGNVALLGCLAQIFFPFKKKTVKYAGNWDPNSKQPLSYRLQKKIVSNTLLTKNCKVLVYGNWKNQTKNIVPFFTASYSENDKEQISNKTFTNKIQLLFVGALSKGKQPLISVKVAHGLKLKGYNVELNLYGEGSERKKIENYILENQLSDVVILHGNKSKSSVTKAYKASHFLVFISKSEGWPKVVAEAMFWKCLPLSSKVSCIPDMLGFGKRGDILTPEPEMIIKKIVHYIAKPEDYKNKVDEAFIWSREFTLEKFNLEIKKLLLEN